MLEFPQPTHPLSMPLNMRFEMLTRNKPICATYLM